MTYEILPFFTAFLIGFLGNLHCIGMCGGIMMVLSLSNKQKKKRNYYNLSYNIGRILAYIFICFLANLIGFVLINITGYIPGKLIKLISSMIVINVGFYFIGLFNVLTKIEKIAWNLWNKIYPYIKKIFPIKNFFQGIVLGFLWGHLPCGLVYSALIYSISSFSFFKSFILMLMFGLGTLPSMMFIGILTPNLKKILNLKKTRFFFGLMMIFTGLLNIFLFITSPECH